MQLNNSAVCTLFEGNYHYGVAALVNSLYKNGFTGDIYAGYRGELPPWANEAKESTDMMWAGGKTIKSLAGCDIHFLPVETDVHLTNYKPAFMLALQQYVDRGLFYFDPDITVKCQWQFFEDWINCGVAVVQEIIMNNCSPFHPRRLRWQPVIEKAGRRTERLLYNYFNGGFCGVKKNDLDFIKAWYEITETGIKYFDFDPHYFTKPIVQTNIIPTGDQDALNIAAMCSKASISDFGPEGMDFIPGGWLMSHATGQPKPWHINYIKKALRGEKISLAEKNYWSYINSPIITHTNSQLKLKKLSIKIASLINRLYSKK
jgi:hypothetical protein